MAGPGVSVEYAMEAGVTRAERLAEIHGITSRPVLDCLVRWDGIIEEIRSTDAPAE